MSEPGPGEAGYRKLIETRARQPWRIAEAATARRRRSLLEEREQLLIIAADHSARGALGVGNRPLAMASRADLLRRLCVALDRPGVDGVLATPTSWRTSSCSARWTGRSSSGR
nr:hypothetical protein GCM10020093_061420 [Planobispora longispora]